MAAMVDRIFFILVLFDVIHKGIRVGVTLVGTVTLTTHFLPVVVGREEGVGFCRGIVDLRQTETVGEWQGLLYDSIRCYDGWAGLL